MSRVDELLAAGWAVEPTSMYDEEGVDGWLWTAPSEVEYMVSGPHHEGPVEPDGIDPSEVGPVLKT